MADSIRFTGFYYEDALRRLMQMKAIYMPWHTEEDPLDPINAHLILDAYRMHRDASLLDMAATELYWTSLQQRASALAAGKIIGYDLAAAIPAGAYLLAKLTSLPSTPLTVIPAYSQFATEGDGDTAALLFEAQEDLTVAAATMETYADPTTGDVYIGHRSLQFDAFTFSAATYAVGYTFAKEFWDANFNAGDWNAMIAVDGTSNLTKAGEVTWDINYLHRLIAGSRWGKTTVNSIDAYWIKFAATAGVTPIKPVTPAATMSGDWWCNFLALQGQTVDEMVGATTSAANQVFRLGQTPFVESSLSALTVGTETNWLKVNNFLLSGPQDRVYRLQEDVDGWYIEFGDGVNGRIPGDGLDVNVTYRIGADENGNAGAGLITVNRSSTPRLDNITNPLAATGWVAPEGSTEASLNKVRWLAPATLRANDRAVTLEDHETLAMRFLTADGRRPVVRAYATKSLTVLRAVEVFVVGAEGAELSAADLAELNTYFNGYRRGSQLIGGCCMHNATAIVANYVAHAFAVTATIYVLRRYAASAKAAAEAALTALINPLKMDAEDLSWLFWPESTISDDILKAAVVAAVPGFSTFSTFSVSPSMPHTLTASQLPTAGTMTVTVVEV